jgi:dihydroorotase
MGLAFNGECSPYPFPSFSWKGSCCMNEEMSPVFALFHNAFATPQAEPLDCIIEQGHVFLTSGLAQVDVGITEGKIVMLAHSLKQVQAKKRINAKGLTVLPGVIDTQVHFREPGLEYKEDLESGTRGAVAGGVTGVFEMPNTKPGTTTPEALTYKLNRANETAWCNYAFYVGASAENVTQLDALEAMAGCCGVKLFMGASTGDLLVRDDDTIRQVLAHGKRRIAIHAEDDFRLESRKAWLAEQPHQHPRLHPQWRDAESALLATQRVTRLAREQKRPLHVLHITTGDEMAYLATQKDICTVETTPQHLTLCDEDYERLGSLCQMNPPIRSKAHREGVWWGVNQGVVDVIGSDHAPHTREEKAQPYPQSPAGMTGVQTLVPLMLNHVNEGRLSLQRFVDLTSTGAARLFNLVGKGRIALGYDADFTVVDLNATRTIEDSWIESKVGWSPYHNKTVQGWPIYTIIAGECVMAEGELRQKQAMPFTFWDTLRGQ